MRWYVVRAYHRCIALSLFSLSVLGTAGCFTRVTGNDGTLLSNRKRSLVTNCRRPSVHLPLWSDWCTTLQRFGSDLHRSAIANPIQQHLKLVTTEEQSISTQKRQSHPFSSHISQPQRSHRLSNQPSSLSCIARPPRPSKNNVYHY